jgi:cytochrome c peroxidase
VTDLPNRFKNGAVSNTNNTPTANPITDAGATLGRVLFYDQRMSHGDGVSCASCHRQANGFSDPNQFSTGFDGQQTGRHSMGITNAVYYDNGRAFWDERAASLGIRL